MLLALLPAVLALFLNASLNKHRHVLPNGQVIEHAHPFQSDSSQSPYQKHSHTRFEFVFLSQISHPDVLVVLVFVFGLAALAFAERQPSRYKLICPRKIVLPSCASRAPPRL